MKLYAIYRIHNIKTNMDYIGWSTNPINRVFAGHDKANSYIGNAICLYGWDAFNVDILHLVKTKEEACRLEIEEIVKHNCYAPNGYNLTFGGEGGYTHNVSGKNNGIFGKHHTEKTKKKLRKSHLGKNKGIERSDLVERNKKNKGKKKKSFSKIHKINMRISRIKYELIKLEKEL